MVILGLAVRHGSTPVDDWFHQHGHAMRSYLLFFTEPVAPRVVLVLATLAVTLYRRQWRLAVAAAVCPLLAMGLARLLKPLFGREAAAGLCLPEWPYGDVGRGDGDGRVGGGRRALGGARRGRVLPARHLGRGVSLHYFTDTVGALLLGTAIVCVAALTSGHAPHRT